MKNRQLDAKKVIVPCPDFKFSSEEKAFLTIYSNMNDVYIRTTDCKTNAGFGSVYTKSEITSSEFLDYTRLVVHDALNKRNQLDEPIINIIVGTNIGYEDTTFSVNNQELMFDTVKKMLIFMANISTIHIFSK